MYGLSDYSNFELCDFQKAKNEFLKTLDNQHGPQDDMKEFDTHEALAKFYLEKFLDFLIMEEYLEL